MWDRKINVNLIFAMLSFRTLFQPGFRIFIADFPRHNLANPLYFVEAQFDQTGNPESADLIIAQKNSTGFQRLSNSNEIMKNLIQMHLNMQHVFLRTNLKYILQD